MCLGHDSVLLRSVSVCNRVPGVLHTNSRCRYEGLGWGGERRDKSSFSQISGSNPFNPSRATLKVCCVPHSGRKVGLPGQLRRSCRKLVELFARVGVQKTCKAPIFSGRGCDVLLPCPLLAPGAPTAHVQVPQVAFQNSDVLSYLRKGNS